MPSDTSSNPFTPEPIPEARAFRWGELLRPTRVALRELLLWLKAACETSTQQFTSEHASTSLLIHGARGTGKTTALLTAAWALKKPKAFLGLDGEGIRNDAEGQELKRILDEVARHITWLDPIDLEPLPAKANLLATVLVRVRAALDQKAEEGGSYNRRSSSILEGSAEDNWSTLDQLINDATFMWEDIPATTDTRQRTEQQIRASEIFAHFQPRFITAMERVAKTLSLPQFGAAGDNQGILVLPIDNVDRSIEHLYSIVKLTRMATSRRLWFILAAGHQEFQLFMERSFQKELIVSGQAGIGPKGRDETLAIARRQAATTLRRALPPNYRISLDPVKLKDAWGFHPRMGSERPGPSDRELPLGALLAKLELPKNQFGRGECLECFSDLFDLGKRLSPSVAGVYWSPPAEAHPGPQDTGKDGTPELIFTDAARMALHMPARTLQDLWQAAYRAWKSPERDEGEKAVRVATEMLRNAIDESELPAWASQQLLNRIIRQDVQGRTVLDLTGRPVIRAKRTTLADVMKLSRGMFAGDDGRPSDWAQDKANRQVLISELHLRRIHEVLLLLNDLEKPSNSVPMPSNVAGWFMLLHDLLMLFEEPRVLNLDVKPFDIIPELVVTLHELWVESSEIQPFVKLDFMWSLPSWDTFIDFNIFTVQWRAFLNMMQRQLAGFPPNHDKETAESRFRLVLAAWIDNVCSVASKNRGQWNLKNVEKVFRQGKGIDGKALGLYEQHVQSAVGELARRSGAEELPKSSYSRLSIERAWLKEILPMFALPEFAPSPKLTPLLVWKSTDPQMKERWDELVGSWQRHLHRLTRKRQDLVRGVIAHSSTYEALRKSYGADSPEAAKAIHSWIDQVSRAWFEAVDEDHEDRPLEVLRFMAPLAMDEQEQRKRGEHGRPEELSQ